MLKTALVVTVALVVSATVALAQAPRRVRGTVASADATTLLVTPNDGGAATALALSSASTVVALLPAKLSDIGPGSFIGIAAETQADGTLVAREVHIFPESMRGSGEGHRPFDLGPKSTMTNGTVGQEVTSAAGNTLTVTYKGGEKSIVVPAGAPIVTFAPGDRAMLMPGAHVIVQAQTEAAGGLVAQRVTVGKDGLVPPM